MTPRRTGCSPRTWRRRAVPGTTRRHRADPRAHRSVRGGQGPPGRVRLRGTMPLVAHRRRRHGAGPDHAHRREPPARADAQPGRAARPWVAARRRARPRRGLAERRPACRCRSGARRRGGRAPGQVRGIVGGDLPSRRVPRGQRRLDGHRRHRRRARQPDPDHRSRSGHRPRCTSSTSAGERTSAA